MPEDLTPLQATSQLRPALNIPSQMCVCPSHVCFTMLPPWMLVLLAGSGWTQQTPRCLDKLQCNVCRQRPSKLTIWRCRCCCRLEDVDKPNRAQALIHDCTDRAAGQSCCHKREALAHMQWWVWQTTRSAKAATGLAAPDDSAWVCADGRPTIFRDVLGSCIGCQRMHRMLAGVLCGYMGGVSDAGQAEALW
jgi:hypothetical protein